MAGCSSPSSPSSLWVGGFKSFVHTMCYTVSLDSYGCCGPESRLGGVSEDRAPFSLGRAVNSGSVLQLCYHSSPDWPYLTSQVSSSERAKVPECVAALWCWVSGRCGRTASSESLRKTWRGRGILRLLRKGQGCTDERDTGHAHHSNV